MKKLSKIKEDKKISSRQLAKDIGTSKTTIDNGLQCKTEEFKFEVFFNLVQYICNSPGEQREIIHEYILLCKSPLNVRKALCYCQAMGEYDLIKRIIEKYADTKGLKKYITVYKIQNKRNQNVARGQQLLDEMYEKDFSSDADCQAALNILYMEAISVCEEIQVPQKAQKYLAFHTTLAHLYIENGINLDKIEFNLIHKSELAFYECMYGDREKGIKFYEELRKEGGEFTSFQQYSFSKVNNDIIGLKEFLESFELTGNIFLLAICQKGAIKRRGEVK